MARPKYMAKIVVTALDTSGERVETTVKAVSMDDLKRKVNGVMVLMDETDLESGR